jgi:5-methylcytosine-specific restriction endonuclease McrA
MKKKRKTGDIHYKRRPWKNIREQVLVRDQYTCQLRLPVCVGVADRVDHWIPRSKGGSDSLGNLFAACNPCNSSKKDVMANPVVTVNW